MSDLEQMAYSLRSQAEEARKLWENGTEFGPDEINEFQRTIVALGEIVLNKSNRRAAA